MERTEGCKQLVELMPVTVACARLLTDAPLKSHNTPAKKLLLLLVSPTPSPFSDGEMEAQRDKSLPELYLNAGSNCFCPVVLLLSDHLAKDGGKAGQVETSSEMMVMVQQS